MEGNGGDDETDEGDGRESETQSDVEHGNLTESVTNIKCLDHGSHCEYVSDFVRQCPLMAQNGTKVKNK